jgi:hypothetical protein
MISELEFSSCVLGLDSYAIYLIKNLTRMRSQLHPNYDFNTLQVNFKIEFFCQDGKFRIVPKVQIRPPNHFNLGPCEAHKLTKLGRHEGELELCVSCCLASIFSFFFFSYLFSTSFSIVIIAMLS